MAGLREVGVVDDIDVSGRDFNREGIDEIRRLAKQRKIDAVAVYDVSRLGRNVLESLLFIKWLADHGVTVVSACELIDTSTPAGKHMLTNMLSIAQYRSDEIGRNWQAVVARRAEQGYAHNACRGYLQRDKTLVIDPVEGPAMLAALRSYAKGTPIAEINRTYAAATGRTGMYVYSLKNSFRNPQYVGFLRYRGQILPGRHEPLLVDEHGNTDLKTWDRIKDRLARESGEPSRSLDPTWSMIGIAFCPDEHRLQRAAERLMCSHRRGDRIPDCDGIGYPLVDRVEAEVLRQVAEWTKLLRTDVAGQAAHISRHAQAAIDAAGMERQLVTTRNGIVKLTTAWSLGGVDDDTYKQSLAELKATEIALVEELAKTQAVVDLPTPAAAATAGEDLLRMWPDMTVAEKGAALRAVVERVVVRRAGHWREPESKRVRVKFHALRPAET